MHKSLYESKFPPDPNTNIGVICPLASEKLIYNVVTTLALSFLIGSSSFLQIRKTFIKAWMSSSFCQIRLRTAELASLVRLKNPHRLTLYNGRKVVNTLAHSFLLG